jgi:phosphatidylserine/phosphatidylglycerophosphate/cardiolipin synthase-like enzyme
VTSCAQELSQVATADLERLRGELSRFEAGTAVTRSALSAARLGHLWNLVHELGVLDPSMLVIIAGAVLKEREARPAKRVELVWTGLEGKTGYARPTEAVVREMFESAEKHVLIAGYSFDNGRAIFEPLHAVMAEKGVTSDIYLHIERARRHQDVSDHLGREVATFFASNWPFGTPHPTIYVAPNTIDPLVNASMHAKCVVVDERVSIVGSANFTDRGQSRNIEVGARIEDTGFAQALVGQFRAATNAGVFQLFDGTR